MSHKTYCTLNVKYFPFDTQTCDIQFISWTFSGQTDRTRGHIDDRRAGRLIAFAGWTFSGLELNISYSKSFENAMYYKSENQVGSDATEMLFRNS